MALERPSTGVESGAAIFRAQSSTYESKLGYRDEDFDSNRTIFFETVT